MDARILYAVIIVMVLLAIWHARDMQAARRFPDTDLTGAATHHSTTGPIRYMGEATTVDGCEVMCDQHTWCAAYTAGPSGCYGVAGEPAPGYASGYRPMSSMDLAMGRRSVESLQVPPQSLGPHASGQIVISKGPREGFLNANDQRIRSNLRG
jgi:hypothetical protein